MEKFYTHIEIHDNYVRVKANNEVLNWSGKSIYFEDNGETYYVIVDDDVVFSCPTWCSFVSIM